MPACAVTLDQSLPAPVAARDPGLKFRPETWWQKGLYYLQVPVTWTRMVAHNFDGILHVLDIVKFRPMQAGLLSRDHPWVTGLQPGVGRSVWHRNILYQSAPSAKVLAHRTRAPEADEVVITKVGRFLSGMVAKSVPVPEIPWGPQRRMPHGINYLHGPVHYDSGIILLNDFAEAIHHFTDPSFVAEVRRFAWEERREVLLVFRERDYDRVEFSYLVAFLRSILPWFSNSNGPKKRVLWGNPAPYAVVNIITGNWKAPTYKLKEQDGAAKVVRPPVEKGRYFPPATYQGTRAHARWPEKLLAHFTDRRIKMRGEKENLFFVDRRKLLQRYHRDNPAT